MNTKHLALIMHRCTKIYILFEEKSGFCMYRGYFDFLDISRQKGQHVTVHAAKCPGKFYISVPVKVYISVYFLINDYYFSVNSLKIIPLKLKKAGLINVFRITFSLLNMYTN